MTELRPCPFCGGEAVLKRISPINVFYVKCNNKECTLFCGTIGENTEEEAIEKWNSRWMIPCEEGETEGNWHTGTPTEEGWYLLAVNFKGAIGYKANIWTNIIGWQWMMSVSGEVVAWQKIDEYKETEK